MSFRRVFYLNGGQTSFHYKVTKKPNGLAMMHQVREINFFAEILRYAQKTQFFFETTRFNKSYLEYAKSYDAAIVGFGCSMIVVTDDILTTC